MKHFKTIFVLFFLLGSILFVFIPIDTIRASDTTTLTPDANGDTIQLLVSGAPTNHEAVDTVDGEYTYSKNTAPIYDLYGLPNLTKDVIINSITVYTSCSKGVGVVTDGKTWRIIKTGGSTYTDGGESLTTSLTYYSTTWNNNPDTGDRWNFTNINDLQAGVRFDDSDGSHNLKCDHVYVSVNYDEWASSTIEGDDPTGDIWVNNSDGINSTVNFYHSNDSGGTWTHTQKNTTILNTTVKAPSWAVYDESHRWHITADTGISNTSRYYNYTSDIYIYTFNESDGVALTDWTVELANFEDDTMYEETFASNPGLIYMSAVPNGTKTAIRVSKPGYRTRTMYIDLDRDTEYNISFYLPPNSTSNLYVLRVIDEYNDQIDDVKVTVKRSIDGIFENVSIIYTDGYGEAQVFLEAGEWYKFSFNKTGYADKDEDFIPDETYYGMYYPKYFKLPFSTGTIVTYDVFSITVTGTMLTNNSLYVTYVDSNSSTVNWHILVYESYKGVFALNNSTSGTSNTASFYVTGINTSRTHIIKLFYNNSADFEPTYDEPLNYTVWPITKYFHRSVTKFDIDDRVGSIFGDFVLGWDKVVSVALAITILVSLGPFNVAMGLIGAGLSLGFMNVLFGIYFTNTFEPLLVLLIPVCIFLGIIYWLTKGTGEVAV